MDKKDRHNARVTSAGGSYPLVVETLRLWSTNSLDTLKSITSKVCAVLAVPFWKTFMNLLEQLYIKLAHHPIFPHGQIRILLVN